MKLLVLLALLTSCSVTYEVPVLPAPDPIKPEVLHHVGECFEFIKAAKEEWENQPQVIVKILKIGGEKYLVKVMGNDGHKYNDIAVWFFLLDGKEPIPCP